MFTQQNTEGYSDQQLALLNEKLSEKLAQLGEYDEQVEQHISEQLLREFDTELAETASEVREAIKRQIDKYKNFSREDLEKIVFSEDDKLDQSTLDSDSDVYVALRDYQRDQIEAALEQSKGE